MMQVIKKLLIRSFKFIRKFILFHFHVIKHFLRINIFVLLWFVAISCFIEEPIQSNTRFLFLFMFLLLRWWLFGLLFMNELFMVCGLLLTWLGNWLFKNLQEFIRRFGLLVMFRSFLLFNIFWRLDGLRRRSIFLRQPFFHRNVLYYIYFLFI